MNATNSVIAAQQRQRLEQLRTDAPDIAAIMADEIWDRFEVEIDEATEGGILLETAGCIGEFLGVRLMEAFERSFEHHVLKRCEQLVAGLNVPGELSLAIDSIDLAGLRKSFKLRRRVMPLIESAVEQTKPGVARAVGAIFDLIFSDPLKTVDVEKDMLKNGANFSRTLLSKRMPMRNCIIEESHAIILCARLELMRQLEQWESADRLAA